MHTYIFVVSGFTQQRHSLFGSGSHGVHAALLPWQSPTVSVRLLQWSEDPVGHARRIAATTGPNDLILLNVYSYAGGFWFVQCAAELRRLGRTVDSVVMCDPVYRSPLFFMRWRAMIGPTQTIRIPDNVRRVTHFTQYVDKPGGENIALPGAVKYFKSSELPYPHIKMDNAAEYLDACVSEAKILLGEPS